MPPVDSNTIPTMPDIEVSLEGVVKLLKELNPNKASGPDGIPAHILKLAAEEVAPALCSIFQKSLDTGVLPSSWLCANISPVFKKGDRSLASNYRPVSLTSICCKSLSTLYTLKLWVTLITTQLSQTGSMALDNAILVNHN